MENENKSDNVDGTDKKLIISDVKKSLHLLYINEISDCDSCDVRSEIAVIQTLSGEVIGICKSCLEKIISEF